MKRYTRWTQLLSAAKSEGYYIKKLPSSTIVKKNSETLAGIRRYATGEITRLGIHPQAATTMTLAEAAVKLDLHLYEE